MNGRDGMGYVYVGPQFRDRPLRRFHFYREIPAECAKDPVFRRLFVAPEELDKAQAQIAVQGTLLHTLYQRAIKLHNAKGE